MEVIWPQTFLCVCQWPGQKTLFPICFHDFIRIQVHPSSAFLYVIMDDVGDDLEAKVVILGDSGVGTRLISLQFSFPFISRLYSFFYSSQAIY